MKVRVCYTEDVDDFYREAINRYYGKSGKATRAEVADWLRQHGSSLDDELANIPTAEDAKPERVW